MAMNDVAASRKVVSLHRMRYFSCFSGW